MSPGLRRRWRMRAGEDPEALLRLEASATLHGAYRWAERRLYELTGRWSGSPGMHPEVQVHLFEMSVRHAWHADLWAERLPVLAGVDTEALTRPWGPALEPLFGALAGPPSGTRPDPEGSQDEPEGPGEELRRLAGLYRVVLPRLLATYRRHLAVVPAVSHGPIARALSLVLRDEEDQLWAGEALIQGLLATSADVRRVTGTQVALESLVVGSGVGVGLVPWSEAQMGEIGLRPVRPT
jgi:hypothetical protein